MLQAYSSDKLIGNQSHFTVSNCLFYWFSKMVCKERRDENVMKSNDMKDRKQRLLDVYHTTPNIFSLKFYEWQNCTSANRSITDMILQKDGGG